MTTAYLIAIILFIILSSVLCLTVLMQEGKSASLGASFGGDAGDSLFGTATADVLKTITGWLVLFFFAACLILSLWTARMGRVAPDAPQTRTEIPG
ncbi:MAG: preprotein translocase subunit SecG [Chlamydiia bacterium]|nr:preprotein translocase subunit SecG [Chlamydiia bacterium]